MIQMSKEVIEYTVLIILISSLLLVYCLYVINDESKRIKYYKKTILYETAWDKYSSMVKEQRKIIIKKKIQLVGLSILVFFKEVITWKR